MSEGDLPLEALCELAIQAAREAGAYIQKADRSTLALEFKQSGSSAASQVVTEIDRGSEAIIRRCLQSSCEQWDMAFVGEESSQDPSANAAQRFEKPWFWCVDPLDGTHPFVEGRAGYAVSIALVDRLGKPLIGVVFDPVDATLSYAIRGQGAFNGADGTTLRVSQAGGSSLVVFADESLKADRQYSRVQKILDSCAREIGAEVVAMRYGAGAVKNARQVLDFPMACYLKPPKSSEGGGSIWDFAATACIVSEAGGWVSNAGGDPLDLNRAGSTFMNHEGVLFASTAQIAACLTNSLKADS